MKRFLYKLILNFFYKEIINDSENPVITRKSDIIARIKTMKFLEKIGVHSTYVVFGDSNSENLKSDANQKGFDSALGFGVNIGIGGSTPGDWVDFLHSEDGKLVFDFVRAKKYQIMNIGGNCVLRNKMNEAKATLSVLHNLFPSSINCLVPPIWYAALAQRGYGDLKLAVEELNETISSIWGSATVDTHTVFIDHFKDSTGEPYFWVLQDAVHFSEIADNSVRIPLIVAKCRSL